jgi:hypothetical protein
MSYPVQFYDETERRWKTTANVKVNPYHCSACTRVIEEGF